MKKCLTFTMAALFSLLAVCLSCATDSKKIVPVEGLRLDPVEISIKQGETKVIEAIFVPANANNRVLKWKSDNEGVATISSAGKVEGIGPGTAVITATTFEGGYSATCEVKVITTPVTGVTLNKTTLTLIPGATEKLVANMVPSTATDSTVTWESNMPTAAKVNSETGLVTAVAVGTATITVTTRDGGFTARCQVAVMGDPNPAVKLELDHETLDLDLEHNKTATLKPTVTMQDGTPQAINTGVEWTSSKDSVASVANGLVTANSPGTATITATYGVLTAACTVTVTSGQPIGLAMSEESHSLRVEKTFVLNALIKYSGDYTAENTSPITWTTSDSGVARVNNSASNVAVTCEVRAIAPGTATIKAQMGDFSAECTVTIGIPDIYVATTETFNDGGPEIKSAYLWKNGTKIPLSDGTQAGANALFVADNGTVYVAGWENDDPKQAVLWVYSDGSVGEPVILGAEANQSEANSVHGLGDDIYVAGYQNNGTINNATLWKYSGGSVTDTTTLGDGTNPSEAKSVHGAGGLVYVVGSQNNGSDDDATLWIWDGAASSSVTLDEGGTDYGSVANSVHCNGRYVYAVGDEEDGGANAAVLWIYDPVTTDHRRVEISLSDATYTTVNANSVFTAGEYYSPQDIYVAGYRTNKDRFGAEEAVFWIIIGPIPSSSSPTISEVPLLGVRANSVFRLGNEVYVAGEKEKLGGLLGWNPLATGWQGGTTWQGSLIGQPIREWQTVPLISADEVYRGSVSVGVVAW